MAGFHYQESVSFRCDLGFQLSGSFSRFCLETGQWSGEEPVCTPRICPELPELENGFLSPVPSLEFGALASYSCLPGFTLLGGAEPVCGHEGA